MSQHALHKLRTAEGLSAAQRGVAEFLEASFKDVPFLSTADIAERTGVSKATVVRAVQKLGFSGLDEVKEALRRALYEHAQSPAERALVAVQAEDATPERLLAALRTREVENVDRTLAGLDPAIVTALCGRLVSARRVWVCGFRHSHPAAQQLGFMLLQLLPDVMTVGMNEAAADVFSMATPQDYVLIVAHTRVARQKIRLRKYLEARGIPYSLITERVDALPDNQAEFILLGRTEATGAFRSYTAFISIANVIARFLEVYSPMATARLSETEVALGRFAVLHSSREGG